MSLNNFSLVTSTNYWKIQSQYGLSTHYPTHPPLPPKKSVTPLPPTSHSAEKMVGPIIFKIGRGDLFFSSTRTYVSTGLSDENGWSPRPYLISGRTDRSQTLVGAT